MYFEHFLHDRVQIFIMDKTGHLLESELQGRQLVSTVSCLCLSSVVVSQLSGLFGLGLLLLGEKRLLDHLAGKGSTPPVLVLAENWFQHTPCLSVWSHW